MAGILDGYQFDPQAYGGGGGMGLLGLLAQQYGLPFPAQAPQGFAAPKGDYLGSAAGYAPTDYAPQGPPAPPLGPPIDVPSLQVAGAGGYPSDAQLPPTSTPTAGTGLLGGNLFSGGASPAGPAPGAGQQPGIPAQPAAASPGIGDRLSSFWQGLGRGGLTSAIGGLATGQRQDPEGLLERALVQRGVDPQMAHAGVRNPQLLPTLLAELPQAATEKAFEQALLAKGAAPQQARALAQAASFDPEVRRALSTTLYQAPSVISGGTNPLTGEITHQLYNPNNQTLANLAPTAQGGGAAQILTPANAAAVGLPPMSNNQLGQIQALNQQGLTGDEYAAKLKEISPAYAAKVISMSKGDLPYPSGPIMRTPYGQLITDSISSVKPGVTAQDYSSKQSAQKSWTSGPDAAAVKSLNQAINHGDQAWNFIKKFPNLNIGGEIGRYINTPYTSVVAALSPQYASDVQEYQKLTEALAGELRTASAGSGHGTIEQIRAWKEGADKAASPAEMRGSIRGAMDFLHGAAEALATKKAAAFRSQEQITGSDLLEPERQKQFDRIRNSTEGGAPQQGTASQQQSAQGQQQAPPVAPSAPAIAALRQNPQRAPEFDAKYGAGSAARVLGQR